MSTEIAYQWQAEIATRLRSVNKWQERNLALFSLGIVRAKSCRQGQIAEALGEAGAAKTVERRLQRFVSNEQLPLAACQVEWSRWVLDALVSDDIVLLVDETQLGNQLGVMMVGVAYEKRCIPLVWQCYRKDAYPVMGQVKMIAGLLQRLKAALPADCVPLVQVDRGLGTSPALIREVEGLGWRYLFRVQGSTKGQLDDGAYLTLGTLATPGETCAAHGTVFKKRGQLTASVRVIWQEGQPEPWVLLTNDPSLSGREYAQRNWQEQGFRDLKSGGWRWDESHVWIPAHAERLLLLLALAYGWVLALGCLFIYDGRASPLRTESDGTRRRRLSIFREGLAYLIHLARIHQFPPPVLIFAPDKRLL